MNHLETLIEEYQGELAELEKAYHTFTDVVGNHFDPSNIIQCIQMSITELRCRIEKAESELSAHNEQFKGEKEFDKYENY